MHLAELVHAGGSKAIATLFARLKSIDPMQPKQVIAKGLLFSLALNVQAHSHE